MMDMYKCLRCNRIFLIEDKNKINQHGEYNIINGSFLLNICNGTIFLIDDIETENNEKDSICMR
jgi:hypothetical protein